MKRMEQKTATFADAPMEVYSEGVGQLVKMAYQAGWRFPLKLLRSAADGDPVDGIVTLDANKNYFVKHFNIGEVSMMAPFTVTLTDQNGRTLTARLDGYGDYSDLFDDRGKPG